MSPPRRSTATTALTTMMVTITARMPTITPITATRITGTAITRIRAPSRIFMDRTAAMITITITIPRTATPMRLMEAPSPEPPANAELPLLLWLSPAFPVGSFAYSHGLEWAVEAGDIVDAATLGEWLSDLLHFGAPRSDAILFACAFRAARTADWAGLDKINELAVALAGSAERRLETTAQGAAFLTAMRAAWTCAALSHLPAAGREPVAYPIAVGVAAAGHGLSLDLCLSAFVLSQFANFVSAAVRLRAIGQTDGQKALAAILLDVRALARDAAGAGLDDLGSCAFRSDIAAIRHETQYSRLFRS
jgi:urease accessory protein